VPSASAGTAPPVPGITSNQILSAMKNDAFGTRPDSMALALAGAPEWAGGSQAWNGKSAVLAASPAVISPAAARSGGPPSDRSARSTMSRVPWAA
jgi:hypothetical protein